ncbi:MAG: family 43 glycosylhydrolase [Butyrivibrio sp.]|nr:family 43 glycosylhydrolase [Butyrivibrio sp.]
MAKRGFTKRGAAIALSAAVSVTSLLGNVLPASGPIVAKAAESTSIDKTIRVSTTDYSKFNDTNGDGFGEFQGFGTSLCWWANRVGYSKEMTEQAATLFFDPVEGLGLTIGRYNVGGGDGITDEEVEEDDGIESIPVNENALIFGPEDAVKNAEGKFDGSNMEISSLSALSGTRYDKSDADFGLTRGKKAKDLSMVGWINDLDGTPGDGGNLMFDVDVPNDGDYTVKMLFTLSGTNGRGVSFKVENMDEDSVNVDFEKNNAEPEEVTADKEVVEKSDDTEITETEENKENIEKEESADKQDADTNEEVNTTTSSDDESVNDDKSDVVVTEETIDMQDLTVTEPVDEVPAGDTDENKADKEDISDASDEGGTANPVDDEKKSEPKIYTVSASEINSDVLASSSNKLFRFSVAGVELKAGLNRITIGGANGDWAPDFVKMAVIPSGLEGVLPEGADETEIPKNTSLLHESHIVRSDSVVPGYCVDVTKINTKEHDIQYYKDKFERVDEECGYAWNYDWDADKRQVNILKAANEKAGDLFIAEAFSNSPPYFMTESGCSSGNIDANDDNLRADSVNAFATYMADVIEHLEKEEGIHIQSTTPMNEPYTNYWAAYSPKQEGCHFDIGESQSRIIVALNKALKEKGITDIVFSASDETSIDTAIKSYNALTDDAKEVVTRIDTHTYSGSKRKELRKLAEDSNENLWMSEVDGSNTEGTKAGDMAGGLWLANYIKTDLNGLMPSAWILWDIVDVHVSNKEAIENNPQASQYDFAYSEYDSQLKSAEDWMQSAGIHDGKSLWGVAVADHNNQNIAVTQKYYAFGQYSRYIRPGYTLMASSDNTVAAYSPDEKKVVFVATNTDGSDKTWKYDLSGFKAISDNVTAIRTSGSLESGEKWSDVSDSDDIDVNASKKFFTATAKANSVTTYIVEGVEFDGSEEVIEGVEGDYIFAANGTTAVLPGTVTVTTSHDNQIEKKVTWDTEGKDLSKDCELTGTTEDGFTFTAKLKFVKPNMYYFVDCNADGGRPEKYEMINKAAGLKNEVPDKKLEGDWGRCDDYGLYNSDTDDEWAYGYYAYGNQNIEYTLHFEEGKYNLEFGFKEWWNQSRPMSVYAVIDGQETKLFDTNSMNGKNNWNTPNKEFTVDKECDVTFSVRKSDNSDPVLSFIKVQKLLNTDDLKSMMNKAASLDTTGFILSKKEKLQGILAEAMAVLLSASSTQEDVDAMTSKLDEFVEAGGEGFTEEEIENNDYILYLVDAGSKDTSVIPKGYKLGLYQSVTDKVYGTDPGTGYKWGYAEDDANSIRAINGSTNGSITDTCIYMSDSIEFVEGKSGFRYTFELPTREDNYYDVTLGFKVPSGWGSKSVDIELEGEKVVDGLSISESLKEKTYAAEVKDNELNVFVHNPDAGSDRGKDPILSYIIVKAQETFDITRLSKLIDNQAAAMEGHEYTKASLEAYEKVLSVAKDLIKEESTDSNMLRKTYTELEDAFAALKEVIRKNYTSITGINGDRLYDNNGLKVQAHGGQIQTFTINGKTKYYWYGEDKTTASPVCGVHCYSSEDLYNWTDEGVVLRTIPVSDEDFGKYSKGGYKADLSVFEEDEYFKALYSDYEGAPADDTQYESKLEEVYWNIANDRIVMERPKVLYNDVTKKYVMWWHCDGKQKSNPSGSSYGKARAGIAISDSPNGPFKYVTARKLISADGADLDWDTEEGSVRDMNLFKDNDGTAYVLYSSDGNRDLYIAKLDETYTGLVADTEGKKDGENFTMIFEGASREAPAMFKYMDTYYLITSACTGWAPNKAAYATAKEPLGKWTDKGNPCVGDTRNTTFDTQSTCVIPVDAAAGKFIYMGDRWFNPDDGKDLSDSRYVWLPVEFTDGEKIALKGVSDWTLEDLEGKGTFKIETQIQHVFTSPEVISNSLPSELSVVSSDGSKKNLKVTWNTENVGRLGTYELEGVLENGRTFMEEVSIIPGNLIYFFDCASTLIGDDFVSEFYNEVKALLGNNLLNKEQDAVYTEENKAGYLGVIRVDDNLAYDIGVKNVGNDIWGHGFWAGSNKPVEYAFNLEKGDYTAVLGLSEWWNTTRPTKAVVSADGKEIATVDFKLASNDSRKLVEVPFTLEENAKVTVSVVKTGNPDPVLSFAGIVKGSLKDADKLPEVKPEEKPEDKPEEVKPSDGKENVEIPDDKAGNVEKTEDTKEEVKAYPEVSGKIKKIKKGKNKGAYQLVLEDGSAAKGFVSLKGKAYYFSNKGIAKKGFKKVNGGKYYTDKKGKLACGFKKISGKKYYFEKIGENIGKMATGFKEIGGATYYFGKDGVMRTGKVKINGVTYKFAKSGKLKK